MKTIKGIFGQSILAGILILTLFLIAKQANAQDKTDSSSMNASNLNAEPNDGTVEIIYPAEALAPYTERRGNWSTIAGVNVDLIYPDKFRSKIDATTSYDSLFESYPMSVVQLELGAKYNTAIGSFGIGALGGYGEIQGTKSLELRTLSLIKYAATGTYTLDTLFSEPFLAPYISGQIVQFSWEEKKFNPDVTRSGTTSPALAITLGVLMQLNWIEPDVSLAAQTSSGLQNTYLDLFISQYNTSDSQEDPNFETAMNFGGGLKLEF